MPCTNDHHMPGCGLFQFIGPLSRDRSFALDYYRRYAGQPKQAETSSFADAEARHLAADLDKLDLDKLAHPSFRQYLYPQGVWEKYRGVIEDIEAMSRVDAADRLAQVLRTHRTAILRVLGEEA